jgi:hypothetical protein
MNLGELATNYAIDFYVSDLGDNTYDEFWDSLCEYVIPEDVSIWSPFEHYDADDLIEAIDSLANQFLNFHEEAKNAETE